MNPATFLVLTLLLFRVSVAAAGETFPPPPKDPDSAIIAPDLFQDTKLVAYEYDPNRTYPIKTRVKVYTEIVVPEDEKITAYYPSADDKRGWPYTVSGDKRHVFVMPKVAGSVNTATLITNKRSYLLTFEATDSGAWFQRVRWIVPSPDQDELPTQYEEAAPDTSDQNIPSAPSLADMFVNYNISGDANFAPSLVADNGKFTWFRIPRDAQELPALFVLDDKDRPELVNYTIDPNGMIKAQRVADAWLLKLGDQEVKVMIKGRKPVSKGFFGWFD
ncbi:MAG: TrbG/VirB9 family P-type conjugative transfer protein [Sulfuriferula sp.]